MSRWLARLLALAMLVPAALIGQGARPAQAQRVVPQIFVLDFNNRSGIGGPLMGRQAAAQLVVELTERGLWEIIPDRQVQEAIAELGIRAPFDKIARQQIARRLDAEAVVYGTVEQASIVTDPMQAHVRVEIVAEDIVTGTLFNGATVEASSTPRMGHIGEADLLLEEALGKAAYRAVQFMYTNRMPTGTVLNTAVVNPLGGKMYALLNVGARQGIRRGMDMVVTRHREPVGVVTVIRVDANDSTAVVIANIQGVKPEDRVRGIFRIEERLDPRRKRIESENARVVENPQLELPGIDTPEPRKAARPARPLAVSLKGGKAGRFEPMVASAPAPGDSLVAGNAVAPRESPGDSGAKRNGRNGGDGEEGDVVVTDENTVTVDQPKRQLRRDKPFISSGTAKILAGGAILAGLLALGGRKNETQPFGVSAVGFQPDGVGTSTAGIRVRWRRPRGIQGNTGGNATTLQPGILGYVVYRTDMTGLSVAEVIGGTLADLRFFLDNNFVVHDVPNVYDGGDAGADPGGLTTLVGVTGVIPGHKYRYQIQPVYHIEQDYDGDGTPDSVDALGPVSGQSNGATVIVPGVILSPAQGDTVDLSSLSVRFTTTPGATQYALMVSRNLAFSPNATVRSRPIAVVPPDRGGPTEATISGFDASRRPLTGGSQVFITVLAWTVDDPFRPVPWGGITYPPIGVGFTIGPPPPPRPESAAGRRGGRK